MILTNKVLCDLCGNCVAVCPQSCIEINHYCLKISHEQCIECQNCVAVCPSAALKQVQDDKN
ncbi:MAG: 4Fe-4S binding protein [Candidatus Marinimicrobia bacterium]|nr:4Fe-4S binding protein [Candidatus Neomarinimicrobiota bacterium]